MKFDSLRAIQWYAATLGVAAGGVVFVYLGVGPVIPCALGYALLSYASLKAVRMTSEASSPYHKTSEYIAAAGIVLFLPFILLSGFLTALVVFLGFAQLALNFQTHDYRRFYIGILVSFVGLCVGATESKSGYYLLFFLFYTLFAGMAIGYADMARRQGDGEPDWDWLDRLRISVLLICVALVVYLSLPRLPAGGLWAQPGSDHFYHNKAWESEADRNAQQNAQDRLNGLRDKLSDDLEEPGDREVRSDRSDQGQGPTGEPEKTEAFDYAGFKSEFDIRDPDASGHRFSNRIVARMRSDTAQYLRARIFDQFDGLHWRSSSVDLVKLPVGFNGVDLVPLDQQSPADLQSYEIFIEHDLGDYIFAAAVPVRLKFPALAIGVDVFGQIRSPGALKQGTAYAVTSQYNLQNGRLFAERDYTPLPTYTQLPAGTDPRIETLARQITTGAATQLDIATALEHHLRTQYDYDLDTALTSQNTTDLSRFLFEEKRGHCEFFASALAVMLRTQDIPSRLVTGFSATHRNPLTGYYDIYALDGHAWVEAYVDDQGWVILEPTAYYEGPLPEEKALSAQQINTYVEQQIKQRDSLGRRSVSFTTMIQSLWRMVYIMASAGLAYVKLWVVRGWPWLVICGFIGAGGWVAWRKYRLHWLAYCIHRKVAAYGGDQPGEAVGFYLGAIADLLVLAGFKHVPGDTIERFLDRITSAHRDADTSVLAAAFNRVSYCNTPPSADVAAQYKQLFQRLYALGLDDLQSLSSNTYSRASRINAVQSFSKSS